MTFQSYEYIFLFLPIVFFIYVLVRSKTVLANTLICGASLFFYGVNGWYFLFFLMTSALMDFWLGLRIAASVDEGARKRWLVVSCVLNLGMLSIVKYSNWIAGSLNSLFSASSAHDVAIFSAIPLVPGISFYTFQTLSYTIDIYKRQEHARRNFVDYLSFVSFFPHLVAGPIMRSQQLLSQLERTRPLITYEVAAPAIFLISWGIFKKLVFADNFGDLVNNSNFSEAGIGLIFAYAFAFQIYCDFSAYTDVARGSAKLFSIELPINFRTPYFSTNASEFWQRWHITLSMWVRDYVYIPLGGNRAGRLLTARNLIITMFLVGLWHGAGANYILWGFWQGGLLVLYHYLPIDQKLQSWLGKTTGIVVAILLFFHLQCIGWIFFRGESWSKIGEAFQSIAAMPTAASLADFQQMFAVFVMFAIPIVVTDYLGWRRDTEYPNLYAGMPFWLKCAHYIAMFYLVLLLGKRLSNDFIYFQF